MSKRTGGPFMYEKAKKGNGMKGGHKELWP